MYKFSKRSKANLATIDSRLQNIFNEVIKYYDITIIEGIRDIETQKKYVAEGKSQTMNSKHLKGLAVDIAPYPIDWNNINRFFEVAGCIKTIAQQKGIKIQWGGDWKNFKDYPHWELVD